MKIFKRCLAELTLAILVVGFLPLPLAAATNFSGTIVNPVWEADGNPYIIEGTITVQAGAKLTIKPGVVVKFNEGAKLVVNGELQAIGEASNKIIFTANQTNPAKNNWGGIQFGSEATDASYNGNGEYNAGSIIKNAIIKYAETGITCDNANPYLENNLISDNTTGIDIEGEEGVEVNGESKIISNEIYDNGLGIKINRPYSQQESDTTIYGPTPGGGSLTNYGDFNPTIIIKDNKVINNYQGIYVYVGEKNVIKNNAVSNNFTYGIILENTSQYNILEQNTINGNQTGIIVNSPNSKIIQNTVSYNSNNGLDVSVTDAVIRNNNISGNDDNNLYNQAGKITASYNYWGTDNAITAADKIKNSAASYSVTYSPITKNKLSITGLLEPIITSTITITDSSRQDITGIKPTNTAIYINGALVKEGGYETDWQYYVDLNFGINNFTIYYTDKDGNKSPETVFSIERQKIVVITSLKIDSHNETTLSDSITLTGSKGAGTGIWMNSEEVIAPNENTSWSYTVSLKIGENELIFYAKDSEGYKSNETKIYITRTDINPSEVINKEKSLVKDIDKKLVERLKGMILLQIEENGEAWYLNPDDGLRYYLGRQDNAFNIMKRFGLGVAHNELNKYLGSQFPKRLAGKILLDVQANGEAYYIYPQDLKGYFLGRPTDAYEIMRNLGLGISNTDIRKIGVGEL